MAPSIAREIRSIAPSIDRHTFQSPDSDPGVALHYPRSTHRTSRFDRWCHRSIDRAIDRAIDRTQRRSRFARPRQVGARARGDCLTNHDSDVGSTHWMIFGLRWRSAHADARADERRHRARGREGRRAGRVIRYSIRRDARRTRARRATRARGARGARLRRSIVEI